MNFSIDFESQTPAYTQLYNFLKEDIVRGDFPCGKKLPSKRIVATETGVSVITVEHAIKLLEEEGYVECRERSGVFVIFKKNDFSIIPAYAGPTATPKLKQGGKSQFPFSVLAKAMRKVMNTYGEKVLVKSPSKGMPELRQAICDYLARSRSIHVNFEQVIIGSGAEYLYGLVAQLFGNNTKFAVEYPSYEKIHKVYDSFGIKYDQLTLRSDGIDSLELSATDAKVLHTTPFNSFPSGITASISKKHEYLKWAKENNGCIIEDNYDSELTVSRRVEESLFALGSGDSVIYMNTFSKTVAPAMRMGYMILPQNYLDTFEERVGFYSCTVPTFDQLLLAEIINSGAFERNINRIRRNRRNTDNK